MATRRILFGSVIALLIIGCIALINPGKAKVSPPASTPSPAPTSSEITLSRSSLNLVQVSVVIGKSVSPSPELDAGSVADFYLTFTPSEIQVYRFVSGKEAYTTTLPWRNHPVTEMQYCVSIEKPCELGDQWQPFQASIRQSYVLDWIGARTYFLAASFRDASGMVINSFHRGYSYGNAAVVTLYQNQLISVVNPETPAAGQPPFVRTAVAATLRAAPVTGSVQIEGGRSAAGGIAGSPITLKVQYAATSTAGQVTGMRTQPTPGCREPTLTAPWEAFSAEKSFTTTLALNWVGFYVAAQFRDEKGNLSQVYCDDFSLEGMPARTP